MDKNRIWEILESLRPTKHFFLDEDCWYSCPKHEEYCGNDTECNCGFERKNKLIDEAINLLELE